MYASSLKLQELAGAGNGRRSISRKGEVAIMREGFKIGRVSQTRGSYQIAPNLFYG
jgi:hypothetical protein